MAHGGGPDRPLDGGEKSDPAVGGFVCCLAEYSTRREHQRRGREGETAKPLAEMHIRLLAAIIRQPAGVWYIAAAVPDDIRMSAAPSRMIVKSGSP